MWWPSPVPTPYHGPEWGKGLSPLLALHMLSAVLYPADFCLGGGTAGAEHALGTSLVTPKNSLTRTASGAPTLLPHPEPGRLLVSARADPVAEGSRKP